MLINANYSEDLFTRYKYFDLTDESFTTQLSHIDKRLKEIIYYEFKKKYVMNKCILPIARVNKLKMNKIKENSIITSCDKCIFVNNDYIREKAIAWRLNTFSIYNLCPICGKIFYRDHINNCNFIQYFPFNSLIKEKHLINYYKDKEMFKNIIPNSYNIIDSLLNHQDYYIFGKIIKELE